MPRWPWECPQSGVWGVQNKVFLDRHYALLFNPTSVDNVIRILVACIIRGVCAGQTGAFLAKKPESRNTVRE